ncbi:hypothetical protein MRS44_016917 [Fusarium solani]|uniref:uncharacterized protein n=1 Tax=Fusarium solani TaxID=169388 RepID=UPI0032C3D75A|nr:hypothetical protein MRS44_016917 [Fusarium solani]
MDSEDALQEESFSSITSLVLLGALTLPLLALWASSLFLIRREDNSLPMPLIYMKIIYPFVFLTLIQSRPSRARDLDAKGTRVPQLKGDSSGAIRTPHALLKQSPGRSILNAPRYFRYISDTGTIRI